MVLEYHWGPRLVALKKSAPTPTNRCPPTGKKHGFLNQFTCFYKNGRISLNYGLIFKIWHAQHFDANLLRFRDVKRDVISRS